MADATQITETLKKLNYGIYVVTSRKPAAELATRNHDWVSASTVSWVTQVSMEPLLVGVVLQKTSNLYETIEKSRDFAVHILGEADRALVKEFTGPADFSDEQVNGHHYDKGQTGAPILREGLAVFECRGQGERRLPAATTSCLIGEPVAAQLRDKRGQSIAIEETRFEYGGKEQKAG